MCFVPLHKIDLASGFEECWKVGDDWKRHFGNPEEIILPNALPDRGGDKRWLQAHAELADLHIEKSSTYGTRLDPLANFTESAQVLNKPDEYPVLVRMLDKLTRAVHMIEAGQADEVKEWPDLASLALCAEALRRRRTVR